MSPNVEIIIGVRSGDLGGQGTNNVTYSAAIAFSYFYFSRYLLILLYVDIFYLISALSTVMDSYITS